MFKAGNWDTSLFALGAVFCSFLAGAATAQTTSDAPGTSGIEEVVVTATRSAQPLSKVPVSISAYTKEALDARGVKSFGDVAKLTPGLDFSRNGFGTQSDVSIRGISSPLAGSATTGIYIDDTPIQVRQLGYSATNTYPQVFDLDRIEVLRGPQGTLFGAGSEGGAIRFITPQPSLSQFDVYGRAEVSTTQSGSPSYEAGAAVGGPLIEDRLGFRVSLWNRHDGGYIDRVDTLDNNAIQEKDANSTNALVGRAALTFAPNSKLTITPSIFFQQVNSHDVGGFWEGISDPGNGVFLNGQPLAQPDTDRFYLPALNMQYDFGDILLISNTSYYHRHNRATDDYSTLVPAIFGGQNFIPGATDYRSRARMLNEQSSWAEEIRLQSTDSDARLTWVAGIFLSNSRQSYDQKVVDPQFGELIGSLFGASVEDVFGQSLIDGVYSVLLNGLGVDKQYAGFGEINYEVIDGLKFTVGIRVSRTTFTGSSSASGLLAAATVTQPPSTESDTPVTPKVGLTYQFDDDNMFYTTIAKGYRIGGVNAPVLNCAADFARLGIASEPGTYQSDSVWSYELGAKNKLFGNRVQINSSIYHISWNNIQQPVYLSYCAQQYVGNLGAATSNGFDLQISASPIDGLSLLVALGYTDATYSENVWLGTDHTLTPAISKGDHIGVTPWSLALSVTYDREIFGNYDGYLHLDYQYHGAGAITPALDPATSVFNPDGRPNPLTNFFTLRSGVRWGAYDLSLFMDNVFNAHPALARYQEIQGNPVFRDLTFRPRTIGLTLVYAN